MENKKDLYIIGASGFGREVLVWMSLVAPEKRAWQIKAFLDSLPDVLDNYECEVPIVGDPLSYDFTGEELLICAIGDPKTRLSLCRKVLNRGGRFTTFVHPRAIVSSSARIGPGCILATDVLISPGACVDAFSVILGSSAIGVNAHIEQGVTVSAFSAIGEGAVLKEGVFLGSHAIIAPGTIVGAGAKIGARTFVKGTIPAGATFFGIPGQMIAGF
jgi:sugar O-acyltransferase (sialic acid O-acetyltransferase NeuD family)